MDAQLGGILKRSPILTCLSLEDWREVMAGVVPLEIDCGATLYRAGEQADRLFIVARGAVALREAEGAGDGLGPLGPGELLGTEGLVAGACYARSAQALTQLAAWPVPADRLISRLDDRFDAALAMIATVAGALRSRVKEISDLKLQSTPERLAGYLAELAPSGDGAAVLRLPCEKRELAERLGMDPATLSRAFAKLRGVGVNSDRRDRVTIANLGRLRQFAAVESSMLEEFA